MDMSLERFELVAHGHVLRAQVVFDRAQASELFDERGNSYIDFSSSGYGHNSAGVHSALIEHLLCARVIQSCDHTSVVKRRFIDEFSEIVLRPRGMQYQILLADPAAGTALETALRLAQRHKKRTKIVAFTDSSHGPTDGSRADTSRSTAVQTLTSSRRNTTFMPYCGFFGEGIDTIAWFRRYLEDPASGLARPAAVVVETVQVHGGINVGSAHWLQALAALCAEFDMLLIVDDSLTGCGAVGSYFGFEDARIRPDMVVVSNAIAGGLPMSMLLLKPELDVRRPGERMGDLQGYGLAFAAASALLTACDISPASAVNGQVLAEELQKLVTRDVRSRLRVRGKGTTWGLDLGRPGSAAVVAAWALERGVLVEPASLKDDVLLVRPAITIDETTLREGLDRLDEAVSDFLNLGEPPARVLATDAKRNTGGQNSSIAHQSVTKPK